MWNSVKLIFVSADFSFSVVQLATVSMQHVVLIYIYVCQSIGPCVSHVFLSLCDIKSEY